MWEQMSHTKQKKNIDFSLERQYTAYDSRKIIKEVIVWQLFSKFCIDDEDSMNT